MAISGIEMTFNEHFMIKGATITAVTATDSFIVEIRKPKQARTVLFPRRTSSQRQPKSQVTQPNVERAEA